MIYICDYLLFKYAFIACDKNAKVGQEN